MSSKGRNLLIVVGVVVFFKIKHKPIVGLDTIDISDYIYFVNYNKEGKVGVIDKSGKTIVEPQYSDVYIPNPTKDVFICGDNIIPNDNQIITLDLKEVEIWKIICE